MLSHSQICVKQISNRRNRVNPPEQRLIANVVNNLATQLQDLTINFRKSQSLYLKSKRPAGQSVFIILFHLNFYLNCKIKEIKSREERSKLPFESSSSYATNSILTDEFISQNDDRVSTLGVFYLTFQD